MHSLGRFTQDHYHKFISTPYKTGTIDVYFFGALHLHTYPMREEKSLMTRVKSEYLLV